MNNNFIEIPVTKNGISESGLRIPKALDFVEAIRSSDYSQLLNVQKTTDKDEIITFDLHVNIGQNPENDIRYKERLAVLFHYDDKSIPEVFALRRDFPKLPHLNMMSFEHPRCLCIYEESYDELKLSWRSIQYLEDIREWLYLNAYNKLHQIDQRLEPFLIYNCGNIFLPKDINDKENIYIYGLSEQKGNINLLATDKTIPSDLFKGLPFFVISISGEPQEHGIIDRTPINLYELNEFLKKANIQLYSIIKDKLISIFENNKLLKNRLIILIILPKISTNEERIENDYYAFLTSSKLEDIGTVLNLWEKHDEKLGLIIGDAAINDDEVSTIKIDTLLPHVIFTKNAASIYNNIIGDENRNNNISLIGVGALGSQIFMNLSRMGYGTWTIIDKDTLLPHNLARHALSFWNIGQPKSDCLSSEANNILNEHTHSKGICDDFLNPNNYELLEKELIDSDIIIDASTSIAVERELAEDKYGNGRRVTVFLNPVGEDLVIIAEDKERLVRIDNLEFQYYRHITQNMEITDHLSKRITSIRYSNACRSISSRIQHDHVGLHASIASNIIRNIASNESAFMGLWRIYENTMNVRSFIFPIYRYNIVQENDWEVHIDEFVIELLANAREEKLPNETGGVLLGGYDMLRRKIFIVDTIVSPTDSEEYPTAYIRGIKDLEKNLSDIERKSLGRIKYVGEWHSHPSHSSLELSQDDKKLCYWLKNEMNKIGLPSLMIIFGSKKQFKIYVNE